MSSDRIEEVLRQHEGWTVGGGTADYSWFRCPCGAEGRTGGTRDYARILARAHVAAALREAGIGDVREVEAALKAESEVRGDGLAADLAAAVKRADAAERERDDWRKMFVNAVEREDRFLQRAERYRLAWLSAKRRRGWEWVADLARRNVAHEIEHLAAERDELKRRVIRDRRAADQARDEGRRDALAEVERRIEHGPHRLGHDVSVICSCVRCEATQAALRIVREVGQGNDNEGEQQ